MAARFVVVLVLGLTVTAAADFGDWSTPAAVGAPVNTSGNDGAPWSPPVFLSAPINTPFADQAPALSFDGLTLFYVSAANLPGALGPCDGALGPCAADIFFVTRSKQGGRR